MAAKPYPTTECQNYLTLITSSGILIHLSLCYSFHEIGYYDLPATIDYILNITKQEQLLYVGHSQGTAVFFVMASTRPEYQRKVKVYAAMAPIAYLDNTKGAIKSLSKMSTWLIVSLFLFIS